MQCSFLLFPIFLCGSTGLERLLEAPVVSTRKSHLLEEPIVLRCQDLPGRIFLAIDLGQLDFEY